MAAEAGLATSGLVRTDGSVRVKCRRIMALPSSSSMDRAWATSSGVAVVPAARPAVVKDRKVSSAAEEAHEEAGLAASSGYFLELFAGAGGLTSAVQQLGVPIRDAMDVVGGSEVGFADLLVDATIRRLLVAAKRGRIR